MADTSEAAPDLGELNDDGEPWMLTPEQSWALFDELARCRLGMSGEEFIRRYDAGEWPDPDADPSVIVLAMRRRTVDPPSKSHQPDGR